MLGLRRNIFFSVMIHAAIAASAVIINISVRGAVHSIPDRSLMVSLINEIAGAASDATAGKKKPEDRSMETFVRRDRFLPMAVGSDKSSEGEVFLSAQPQNDRSERSSEFLVSGNAIASVSGDQDSGRYQSYFNKEKHGGLKGQKTAVADPDYGRIRAAIERAKVYPFLARKKKIEGTVVTEFSVNTRGFPEGIRIGRSSGYEILDSAAINIITRAAPFPDANGSFIIPIKFSLTDGKAQ